MNVEEWIRCNKCYRLLRESSQTFSVTQCQHIFCERCVSSDPLGCCPECKAVGVRAMTLQQPWDRTILAPLCRSLPEMMEAANQAAEFQRTQGLIALRRYDELEIKYENLKKKYAQCENTRKTIRQRNEQLDRVINELKGQLSICQYRQRENLPANGSTNIFLSPDERKRQEKVPQCFPTPSDSMRSFHTQGRRQENYPPAMERHAISTGTDRPWTPSSNDSISGDRRSNRFSRNRIAFTPHTYSARAVLSDDTSMTSGNT